MQYSEIKLDQHLLSILKEETFNGFTVVQLRDTYRVRTNSHKGQRELRLYVYRRVKRLCKLGLLYMGSSGNSKQNKYFKSSEFFKVSFIPDQNNSQATCDSSTQTNTQLKIDDLERQLKQYKVDLLASIGESEEYMRLYETIPDIKDMLEENYHQAREHSSKLLGQIKALTTVISHYQ
ncbi:hypothetical protein [Pleionea litopenaei]|uniref:Response regulator n=1 Tax=Pleionea litopenaei TaxID=3070815 RepID=A0AA51RSE3_9GAMM|nr:hypothetical protein [Pleionea sp. HL-JVS1]WMS86702.1 hypothetical protein Q9312_15890 [Pleionea sp. HL-JVS1]